MDKFIQREPTWKKKHYDAVVANASRKNQHAAHSNAAIKRRPLQEHSGLNARSYSVDMNSAQQQLQTDATKNINELRTQSIYAKVHSDAVHNSESPSVERSVNAMSNFPFQMRTMEKNEVPERTTTPKSAAQLERIQRDLDSPSAALRIRAIRALKSPTTTTYDTFDVPHAEQSIITDEERNPPPEPTLPDIFKDVIVYVEVRTGQDNRSAGVKTIIAKLGAQVNDRLLRNTTHVLFKDGLLSTYKKASSWNIPIVSILWIEACKVQRKLCDPEQFPISNKHLYEYSELFPKLTRVRYMQPDSELNKRPRKRHGTPTTANDDGSEGNPTKKSNIALRTPTTTPTSRQKSDIMHFFKPMSLTKQICAINDTVAIESPATNLLNRMTNGQFTPLPSNKLTPAKLSPANEKVVLNGCGDATAPQQTTKATAQRSLSFSDIAQKNNATAKQRSRRSSAEVTLVDTPIRMTRRRSSLQSIANTTNNMVDVVPLEPRMTRRRSSLQLTAMLQVEQITSQLANHPTIQPIAEEALTEAFGNNQTNCLAQSLDISIEQTEIIPIFDERRTVYTTQPMDISEVHSGSVTSSTSLSNAHINLTVKNTEKENRDIECNKLANVTTQTSMNSLNIEQTPLFSSTRLPGRNCRRSIYSVPIDIINERIENINNTTRYSLAQAEQGECHKDAPQAVVQSISVNVTCGESLGIAEKPKMRKLFTPNEEIVFSPPRSTKKNRLSISSSSSSSMHKCRRTLTMPVTTSTPVAIKIAEKETAVESEEEKTIRLKTLGRRSSLDFESVATPKNNVHKLKKANVDDNSLSEELYTTPMSSQELITMPDEGGQADAKRRRRTIRTLVHTNMHHEQIHVIHKAVRKLRGVRLDQTVTKRTTHLVSLEPRRTLNLLRGLMRGVWIVNYGWVLQSLRVGKWVDEEHYEMTSFSRAIKICRAERQAFGTHYRCELFKYMEAFYVSSLCRPVQFNNMKELLLLGGAKLIENRFKAKYIIGDKRRAEDDRIYLSPYWVLDSISAMQIQKFGKYLMKSAIVTPGGIRYENPTEQLTNQLTYKDPEFIIEK